MIINEIRRRVETRDSAGNILLSYESIEEVPIVLNQVKPDSMTVEEYEALKVEERRRRQIVGGCCGDVDKNT